jgi:hypothetical protein
VICNGYGGAPSWVYKREMAYRDMSHYDQERRLSSEIERFEEREPEAKIK